MKLPVYSSTEKDYHDTIEELGLIARRMRDGEI